MGMSPKLPSKLSGHPKVLLIDTVSLRGARRLEYDAVLPEALIIYPTVLAKTVCVAQGVLSCFACRKTKKLGVGNAKTREIASAEKLASKDCGRNLT